MPCRTEDILDVSVFHPEEHWGGQQLIRYHVTVGNFGGVEMTQYSIEQVQTQLNEIIQAVEQGEAIEITRQGTQVAILLSPDEYTYAKKEKSGFGAALEKFRRELVAEGIDLDPDEVFKDVRDRSPGREVNL
jgi:cellobiose PTS system EIIB component